MPGDVTRELLGLNTQTLHHLRDQCTHIIHCAADTSFAARNRCCQVNLAGTENILRLCSWLGPQVRLFFMSSAVVTQGSTGHWPVSSGDPPDGTERVQRTAVKVPFPRCATPISVGESPTDAGESPALPTSRGVLIQEDMPYRGSANDYVRSKRVCEEIVLQSPVAAVILRPSIVLSHGVNSREFARSVPWVMPVIRSLGVLPLRGDERIDLVSVRFVAEAVVKILERPLTPSLCPIGGEGARRAGEGCSDDARGSKGLYHRIYHISAGPETSISWKELLDALTQGGHDYSAVRFDPDLDWATFRKADPRLWRLKEFVNHYLPFMRADVVYDCSRLKQALGNDFPPCPKATDYCAQLLDLFTEREAFAEALNP